MAGAATGVGAPRIRLEEVVELHGSDVLAYLTRRVSNREDAADLLGETLLVLARKKAQLPRDSTEARMWMFGIARNVLLTYHRGVRKRGELVDRLRDSLRDVETTEIDDLAIRLKLLLADLDPRNLEIITLHHWEGFTLAEVARVMKLNASTVRTRYERARAALKAALG